MSIDAIANFTASDLKQSGPILDAATQGVVRIKRRGEAFLLLRETQFETMIAEAADPRPKTLADLLVDYDPNDVKQRLTTWINEQPSGRETL
ncbi:MAG: hypothetical protein B7Z58_13385 [Acidiphilium sp. 37-64-53]|uniref:hypothetical protein n=1 Tax=Acidiphilium TaxID=522 RepID=UPI000BC568C8|nr:MULTISPECIES: hypothetical protein [Acidiphilium]OYV62481.1 MAG: hypothetical protein B7X01_01425 [Acidiphilium sp. 21-62-4]OYW00986.1 MAG: hypothetical protein B7Z58_13385 [Acidiphilium sp. 37-64-53]OZB30315.1 MAG: hypothetical protein B7X49_03340 [Acidiphilium sp. 34-64-41]HQT86038.1 hypothetical protein [Acidiphilium rubrum]